MTIIERPFVLDQSFRDPVHNFIRLSTEERRIVDTFVFQRLRRIHQLGPTFLVYHGAEHSRFGHGLGTMDVATRMFETIERKEPKALGSNSTDRKSNWQLVRLAALLHDVGHAPFSHATEAVMPKEKQSGRHLRHEKYTVALICHNEELAGKINDTFGPLGITPERVAAVIDSPGDLGPEGVVLNQIVSGELDADRMDYLARDSLFTGATYGRYDLGRLLDTITVARWGSSPWMLAVEQGGVFAVEQLLLARYYMFVQVYLHDVRRFFDFALNRFLESVLPDGHYPDTSQLDAYLAFDDQRLLEEAKSRIETDEWARIICTRAPWKTLDETHPHPNNSAVRSWSLAQGRMEAEFGEAVLFDDAEKQAYHLLEVGPYTSTEANDGEGPAPVLVKKEGSDRAVPVEEESTMIQNLARTPIMMMRLYARPDKVDEIEARWEEIHG